MSLQAEKNKCQMCNKHFSKLDHSLRHMRGPTQKKRYSNAPNVIRHSLKHATWRNIRGPTPEAFLMPSVFQQFLNSWPLEGTYGNPLRRDSIQVHKVETEEKSNSSAQSVTNVFQDQVA